MPELPEVETIARGLAKRVTGEVIEFVWLGSKPEPLKSPAREIVATLQNKRIAGVRRAGKHIVFDLEGVEKASLKRARRTASRSGRAKERFAPNSAKAQWIVHLGMTGRMLVCEPGAELAKHTHAIAKLGSGRELRFVDPRRFGRLSVAHGFISSGDEPLEVELDRFVTLFHGRKWLSVPVECGCVVVREGKLLRDAFSLVPAYLRTEPDKGIGGLPWYSEYEFQQTRGFRALKLWTALMHAGRSGLRKHIATCNLLASHLGSRIKAAPDLQLCAPVTLSVVCFRYVPETGQWNERQLETLNKQIMETVQSSGEAFITNAALGGRFVLRACILNYLTKETDLIALIDTVRRTGARISQAMHRD